MDIKKKKEKRAHVLNYMCSTIIVNKSRFYNQHTWGRPVWSFNKKMFNLHFDNELDIHVSSKMATALV